MRLRGYLVLATLAAVATAAACTLNPQPLPPGDEDRNAADDGPSGGGFGALDAGATSDETQQPPAPNDAGNKDTDGSIDGAADGSTEGGDAAPSDGGDAGSDADAG